METPVPIRSLKLSNLGHDQHLDGWPFKCEVDAVVKKTVTSQEWRNGAYKKKTPKAKKKIIFIKMFFVCINFQLRLTFYSVFEQFIQYRLCLVFVQLMFNVHICTV